MQRPLRTPNVKLPEGYELYWNGQGWAMKLSENYKPVKQKKIKQSKIVHVEVKKSYSIEDIFKSVI